MNEKLRPLTKKQLLLILKLINELPDATQSEVGLLDAAHVIDLVFKCADVGFIDERNKQNA